MNTIDVLITIGFMSLVVGLPFAVLGAYPLWSFLHGYFWKKHAAQYAQTHGFTFTPSTACGDLHLFGLIPISPTVVHIMGVVSGSLPNKLSFRLYNFYAIAIRNSSRSYFTCSVLELTLPSPVARLKLVPPGLGLQIEGERVELEGEFSKAFTLYITPGTQIAVLEAFTPDVMQDWLDALAVLPLHVRASIQGIEFNGVNVYLVCRDPFMSSASIETLLAFSSACLSKTAIKLGLASASGEAA